MAKSADAFRTISEVSEWLDTPSHVLRFWESKFSQVKPVKRAGGRRYYRPSDMELLGGIKRLLHEDGMTIKGVQKLLREKGVGHVSELSQPLDAVSAAVRDAMEPKAKDSAEAAPAPVPAEAQPDPVEAVPADATPAQPVAPATEPEIADAVADQVEAAEDAAEETGRTEVTADTAHEDMGDETAEVATESEAPAPTPPPRPSIKAVEIEQRPTVLSLALARKAPLRPEDKVEVRRLATRLQNWLSRQPA